MSIEGVLLQYFTVDFFLLTIIHKFPQTIYSPESLSGIDCVSASYTDDSVVVLSVCASYS